MSSPLISAEELRESLDGDGVILDARPSKDAYDAGHLPGAIHASLDRELSAASDADADPARGGRHPLPPIERWAAQLGAWGIGPETHVVIYDDHDASNAAARAWWMLRSVGHKHVRVLDGGFGAALAESLPLTTSAAQPAPRDPYPVTAWKLHILTMADVDRARRDASWRVVDVRSEPRFRGETEPIDPIAGHIPGAVNLPFAKNVEHGGHFKPAKVLRHQFDKVLGDIEPKHVIVHCGSGVTACQTLLAMSVAGLEGASLYVGSWSEWCRNDAPRATGPE